MEKTNIDILSLSNYFDLVSESLGGWEFVDGFFTSVPFESIDRNDIAGALESIEAMHGTEIDAMIESWYLDTSIKPGQLISGLRTPALKALCVLRFLNADVQIPLLLGYNPDEGGPCSYSMILRCDGMGEAIRWALTDLWNVSHASTLRTYAEHLKHLLG